MIPPALYGVCIWKVNRYFASPAWKTATAWNRGSWRNGFNKPSKTANVSWKSKHSDSMESAAGCGRPAMKNCMSGSPAHPASASDPWASPIRSSRFWVPPRMMSAGSTAGLKSSSTATPPMARPTPWRRARSTLRAISAPAA